MPDNPSSPYIHTADSDTFPSLVLENSHRGPVLVNFCSRNTESCLHQSPILEQVVDHYDGKLLLINVDAETEFVFSREYNISSVPTLILFRWGHVIETLQGFHSEEELQKVLVEHIGRDSDGRLADAVDLFSSGNARAAYEMIAKLIHEEPNNPRLPLTMCKLLLHEQRYAEASKLINTLDPRVRDNAEVRQFAALLSFYEDLNTAEDIDSLSRRLQGSAADFETRRQLVAALVAQQQFEAALQQLVEIMTVVPDDAENYAPQAMLRIFAILGSEHELVSRFRSQLRRHAH